MPFLPHATAHARAEAKRLQGFVLFDFAFYGGITPSELIDEIESGRLKVMLPTPEGREYYGLINARGEVLPGVDWPPVLAKYGIIVKEALKDWFESGSPLAPRFLENMSGDNPERTHLRSIFSAVNTRSPN